MGCGGCSLNSLKGQELKYNNEYLPRVVNTLAFIYKDRTTEFPFCALGDRKGNSYLINELRIPSVYQANDTTAIFRGEDCNQLKKYLGMIHNHPKFNEAFIMPCLPSNLDLDRFLRDKKAQLEMIVCGVSPDGTQVSITTVYKELLLKRLGPDFFKK